MDRILELLEQNKFIEAKKELSEIYEVDIAEFFIDSDIDGDIVLLIFRLLPKDVAASVFSYMDKDLQRYIIESVTDKEIAGIMDRLYLDDTVDMIEEMPANIVKRILRNTDAGTRKLINQFLKYPDDSAGSLMTIEYVDIKKELTVDDSLAIIRKNGIDKETIDTCYVINKNRKLEGIISLRKLILSDGDNIISDLMDEDFVSAKTLDDEEHIAELFKRYDLVTLPVVDNEDRLVGIITIDDVIDIIDQINTEDFHKIAAVAPSDVPYLKTSVFSLAKNRIFWLLILMISSTFTSAIIRNFENTLAMVTILTAYIPMLMNTGGSAGSQTSVTCIRSLALGEIKLRDAFRVVRKEFAVSLIVGSILAVVNFGKLIWLDRIDVTVALVICASLFFIVIFAKLCGGLFPLLAKAVGIDPAIMASPMITTIVDVIALLIYFSLAMSLLSIPM